MNFKEEEQARKSSEDTHFTEYARFEKVWTGQALGQKSFSGQKRFSGQKSFLGKKRFSCQKPFSGQNSF